VWVSTVKDEKLRRFLVKEGQLTRRKSFVAHKKKRPSQKETGAAESA